MPSVLIADDHPVVLEGIAALLSGSGFSEIVRCASGQDVLRALEDAPVDLFVMDINMPPPTGLDLLRELHGRGLAGRTVLLTSSLTSEQLTEALGLGVGGLVLKESAARQLLRCIEAVELGEQWLDPELTRRLVTSSLAPQSGTARPSGGLTARELEVLKRAATGSRNKEIGRELGLTEGTVKMYLHSIYQKLGVSNRMEMVNAARQRRLL